MKKALVILYKQITKDGWRHGIDYWFVINSHDEWQIEVLNERTCAEYMGETMVNAMRKAGQHFNFNVPITGEYKIGKNWSQTH